MTNDATQAERPTPPAEPPVAELPHIGEYISQLEKELATLTAKLAEVEGERDRLRARVAELESKYRHTFITPEQSDGDLHRERCGKCGLNLRDDIHERTVQP